MQPVLVSLMPVSLLPVSLLPVSLPAAGVPAAGAPAAIIISQDESESDYQPSVKGRSIKVKRGDQGKGKGKAKESPKESRKKDEKKPRPKPKPAGLREKTCKRCLQLNKECYQQNLGSACVNCAKLKMRCVDEGDEDTGRKPPGFPPGKKRAFQRPAPHTLPTRIQRFDVNVIPKDFVRPESPPPDPRFQTNDFNTGSKRLASRSPSPAPIAKRQMSKKAQGKRPARGERPASRSPSPAPIAKRQISKKAQGKRPARGEVIHYVASRSPSPATRRPEYFENVEGRRPAQRQTVEESLEELRGEVQRQRLIIDALIPGYIRQKDQIAELEKEKEETAKTIERMLGQLQEAMAASITATDKTRVHRQTVRTHYLKIMYISEQMDDVNRRMNFMHQRVGDLERRNEDPEEQAVERRSTGNPPISRHSTGSRTGIRTDQFEEDGIEIINRPANWAPEPAKDWSHVVFRDDEIIDLDTGLPLEGGWDDDDPRHIYSVKEEDERHRSEDGSVGSSEEKQNAGREQEGNVISRLNWHLS